MERGAGQSEAEVASVNAVSSIEPADGWLVKQTLDGDRKAFDRLVIKYQRRAVAVSYRLLGNTQDALEVTQEAFLKAFTSLNRLEKPDAFGGWLLRIVSNLSLNFRRGRRNKNPLPLDDLLGSADASQSDVGANQWMDRSDGPVHQLQSKEMGQRLHAAINQLPEKQRLALVMFTMDEMPQKEIAVALDCSVEAVKWHVFQGRKRLKELLKGHLQ